MESTLAPEHPPATFPQWLGRSWRRLTMLRYGENPHQQAALYSDPAAWPGLAQAEQLHGKEMSYNNFTDADAAWRAAFDHEETCVAIIKHANPCGCLLPFPDGLETLAAAGVAAIVHPGGSVRDEEVTAAAAKASVTLYRTGARHFAH